MRRSIWPTSFSDDGGWVGVVQNETGVIKQNPITLSKGERVTLSSPRRQTTPPCPGNSPTPDVNSILRASCPRAAHSSLEPMSLGRNIEVPVLRTVDIVAEENTFSGAANGISKKRSTSTCTTSATTTSNTTCPSVRATGDFRLLCLRISPQFWMHGMANQPLLCSCQCRLA